MIGASHLQIASPARAATGSQCRDFNLLPRTDPCSGPGVLIYNCSLTAAHTP